MWIIGKGCMVEVVDVEIEAEVEVEEAGKFSIFEANTKICNERVVFWGVEIETLIRQGLLVRVTNETGRVVLGGSMEKNGFV